MSFKRWVNEVWAVNEARAVASVATSWATYLALLEASLTTNMLEVRK